MRNKPCDIYFYYCWNDWHWAWPKNTSKISARSTKEPISRHCQSIEIDTHQNQRIKILLFSSHYWRYFHCVSFHPLQCSVSSQHAWRRAAANKKAHQGPGPLAALHWDVCWQVVKAACFPPLKRRLWNVPVRVRLQQEGVRRHPLCIRDTHVNRRAALQKLKRLKVIYTDAIHDAVLNALCQFSCSHSTGDGHSILNV